MGKCPLINVPGGPFAYPRTHMLWPGSKEMFGRPARPWRSDAGEARLQFCRAESRKRGEDPQPGQLKDTTAVGWMETVAPKDRLQRG